MARVTLQEARNYLERWELVSQKEVEELRSTPMAIKFLQLCALMESRHLFPPDPDREAEAAGVRERWALLRRVLGE